MLGKKSVIIIATISFFLGIVGRYFPDNIVAMLSFGNALIGVLKVFIGVRNMRRGFAKKFTRDITTMIFFFIAYSFGWIFCFFPSIYHS